MDNQADQGMVRLRNHKHQYLMDQLKEYPRNNVPEDKLAELMPWSETLPDCCKQLKR